jgi:hypothetical protein
VEAFEPAVGIDLGVRSDAGPSRGDDLLDRMGGLSGDAALAVPPVLPIVHDVSVQGAVGGVRPEGLTHPVRIQVGMDIAEAGQQDPSRTVDDLGVR